MKYSRLISIVAYIQCGICLPIVEYIRLGEKISVLWVHVCTLYTVEYIRCLDNLIPCIYVPCLFKSFLLQNVEKCNLLCSISGGGPRANLGPPPEIWGKSAPALIQYSLILFTGLFKEIILRISAH